LIKIQRLPNGQLVITIPKKLAELKNWDKGTILIFKDRDLNSLILEKMEESSNDKKVKKK